MWKDCLTIESFILLLVPSSYTFFLLLFCLFLVGRRKIADFLKFIYELLRLAQVFMPSFYLQGIFSATQVMMNLFKQMEPCRVSPYHSLLGLSDVCSNLVHFSEPLSQFLPISFSVIVLNSYPEQEMKFLVSNTVNSLVSVSVPEF